MGLWVDYYRLQECLEDSLNRLECLQECHLQEHPLEPLPDLVFPLQKVLQDSLEQLQVLQEQARKVPLVELEAQVEVLEPWAQKE